MTYAVHSDLLTQQFTRTKIQNGVIFLNCVSISTRLNVLGLFIHILSPGYDSVSSLQAGAGAIGTAGHKIRTITSIIRVFGKIQNVRMMDVMQPKKGMNSNA